MKYKDFYKHLTLQVNKLTKLAYIGPSFSVKLGSNPKITLEKELELKLFEPFRFIIFPVKLYGANMRHLNILVFDKKTKIIERFEPFNYHFNLRQIDGMIESLLYKMMNQKKLYFLWYKTITNTDIITDNKNCGFYCIKYIVQKLKS